MMSLKIISPGIYTTVQDMGRYGAQHIGLSPSGAMDGESLLTGHQLLENNEQMALEMTMQGGEFEFTEANAFVITGADMQAELNGESIRNYHIYNASAGSTLKFKSAVNGLRTYLTVKGGFDLPTFHNSVSTHTKIKVGGVEGRTLKTGDELKFKQPETLQEKELYVYDKDTKVIRFIPGRQFDRFKHVEETLQESYTVSNTSDRMGIRLEGPALEADSYDIISEPVQLGAIQVTSEGQPIVLMNDRQTVGGYAKIGTVYFTDLAKLAQLVPGDSFRFVAGTLEEAVKEKQQLIDRLTHIPDMKYERRKASSRINQLIGSVK